MENKYEDKIDIKGQKQPTTIKVMPEILSYKSQNQDVDNYLKKIFIGTKTSSVQMGKLGKNC